MRKRDELSHLLDPLDLKCGDLQAKCASLRLSLADFHHGGGIVILSNIVLGCTTYSITSSARSVRLGAMQVSSFETPAARAPRGENSTL